MGMALPSARSGLAGCDGSGLWLSRRHPPAGATPYRNAGAESGARAASAGRGPQRGQSDQALRRPQGKAPGHGRSSSGWRARAQGIRCQRPMAQSAARFRSARRSTPAGRGHQLREWFPRDRRLRAAARPVQGPGLQGQVTTATPVRSRRARARSPSGACSGHRARRQRQRSCGHCHHQAPPKTCACVGVDVPGEAALCPARRRRRCDARG